MESDNERGGNMKRLGILVVVLSLTFFAACGGSGGSSGDTSEQAAEASEASYLAFVSIIEDCLEDFGLEADADGYLVAKQTATTCNCPGGGYASIADDLTTVTATECKSSGGLSFSGAVMLSDAGLINGTIAPFGECSSLTVNNVGTTTCEGTVTGTCAGESVTCTVSGTGDCDISCI